VFDDKGQIVTAKDAVEELVLGKLREIQLVESEPKYDQP